ncbi:hypothetical protein [Desulfurivibrio sp. C05AmB]|uniref:hypothetical protein n=1 Tax=Desulfurivibrio sp. C05AmB TaxID=3374371 RepID=UPI00376EC290
MKTEIRLLWWALVGLAIGAVMLHYRIHPPAGGAIYAWGNLLALADLVLVSLLFLSRRRAVWGLLLNSFIVFLGIIMMADYTIYRTLSGTIPAPGADPLGWFLHTSFPYITIALADFLVGLSLYRLMTGSAPARA